MRKNNYKRGHRPWENITKNKQNKFNVEYHEKKRDILSILHHYLDDYKIKYVDDKLVYYVLNQGAMKYTFIHSRSMELERKKHGRVFWFYGGVHDNTGFQETWELKEVNYSKLAEKMLGIDKDNKVKLLDNGKWLVWVKI